MDTVMYNRKLKSLELYRNGVKVDQITSNAYTEVINDFGAVPLEAALDLLGFRHSLQSCERRKVYNTFRVWKKTMKRKPLEGFSIEYQTKDDDILFVAEKEGKSIVVSLVKFIEAKAALSNKRVMDNGSELIDSCLIRNECGTHLYPAIYLKLLKYINSCKRKIRIREETLLSTAAADEKPNINSMECLRQSARFQVYLRMWTENLN